MQCISCWWIPRRDRMWASLPPVWVSVMWWHAEGGCGGTRHWVTLEWSRCFWSDLRNSLSGCKELLGREWDSWQPGLVTQFGVPSSPGLCVMSVSLAPCLNIFLDDCWLFYVRTDWQQAEEMMCKSRRKYCAWMWYLGLGSGIQGYKKWNPGLVSECAHGARRVTPSVLRSAAGIEGDWCPWGWWCNGSSGSGARIAMLQTASLGPRPAQWKRDGKEQGWREVRLAFDLPLHWLLVLISLSFF